MVWNQKDKKNTGPSPKSLPHEQSSKPSEGAISEGGSTLQSSSPSGVVAEGGVDQPPPQAGSNLAHQRYKLLSYELLRLTKGMQVLDIGCGPGVDLAPLAERVGEEGLVVGIDHDPHVLQAAQETHGKRGNVRLVVLPAEHLPFAHRSFDAARADRVLQFVSDPGMVLLEMWRVLRPGGVVTLVEPDWHAVAVYPSSPTGGDDDHTLRRILRQSCPHPLIGRRLYSLLHQQRKWATIEVRVEPLVFTSWADADALLGLSQTGTILAEADQTQAGDIQDWLQAVKTADQHGEFFASLPLVMVSAQKA